MSASTLRQKKVPKKLSQSIRPAMEEELKYSLETMYVQQLRVWNLTKKTVTIPSCVERSRCGLYIFFSEVPPHYAYLGCSEDLTSRICAQKRLRSTYSYVLIFRLEGYIDEKTLKALETWALHVASKQWPWVKWGNERGICLGDKGPDGCPESPALHAILDEILSRTEAFMRGGRHFDPTPAQHLSISHRIGSPFAERFANGAAHARGMTVLEGSRLPLSVTSIADLLKIRSPPANRAVMLYNQGILDRWEWTLSRETGLYFTQDYRFESRAAAASLISMTERPGSDWHAIAPKSS